MVSARTTGWLAILLIGAILLPITGAITRDLHAQLIHVRTVPLASGDQFLMIPSSSFGLAGTGLAIDDSLGDAWSNPAKGTLFTGSSMFGSLALYGISDDGGGGRTLPLTGLFRGTSWFGGLSFALQEVRNEPGAWSLLSPTTGRNLYARGLIGRELGEQWSIGFAGSMSGLDAMDGVDLLYPRAVRIDQRGSTIDWRLGLWRNGIRDRIGFTVAHSRVSMEHDVLYETVIWDDPPPAFDSPPLSVVEPTIERVTEYNEDKTRSWGARFTWDRKLASPGWRVGASVVTNVKSHPKIPNYEIQNIPRDPGTTLAYEVGFGLARVGALTTYGFDVAFQPVWSDTWQEAEEPTETPSGLIPVGGKTIENDFTFSNVIIRTGVGHRVGRANIKVGVNLRSYSYHLEQVNHVEVFERDLDEAWLEWTPTASVLFQLTGLEAHYGVRATLGTGRPGREDDFAFPAASPEGSGSDWLVAPSGPLVLSDVTVLTHYVWVRIPIS